MHAAVIWSATSVLNICIAIGFEENLKDFLCMKLEMAGYYSSI